MHPTKKVDSFDGVRSSNTVHQIFIAGTVPNTPGTVPNARLDPQLRGSRGDCPLGVDSRVSRGLSPRCRLPPPWGLSPPPNEVSQNRSVIDLFIAGTVPNTLGTVPNAHVRFSRGLSPRCRLQTPWGRLPGDSPHLPTKSRRVCSVIDWPEVLSLGHNS